MSLFGESISQFDVVLSYANRVEGKRIIHSDYGCQSLQYSYGEGLIDSHDCAG